MEGQSRVTMEFAYIYGQHDETRHLRASLAASSNDILTSIPGVGANALPT